MEQIKTSSKIDTIVLLLVIAFTCFEYFFRQELCFGGLSVFCLWYCILHKTKTNYQNAYFFIAISLIWAIMQYVAVDRYKITSIISMLITIVGSFSAALIVQRNFVENFVKIIYWLAIIGLLFYFISFISPIKDFLINVVTPHFISLNVENAVFEGGGANLIIYNFQGGGVYELVGFMRNCGPFWEPGMFAIFLNIALLFNNLLIAASLKYNVILIIALITTFSAGGYLGGMAVLLAIYVCRNKNILTFILGVLLISVLMYLFSQLEFVGIKLSDQMESAEVGSDVTRFGAWYTQLQMIKDSPFFGGGDISQYAETKTLASGTLLPLVTLGIPVGIIFYYILAKSFIKLATSYEKSMWAGWTIFMVIIVISFSQTILLTQWMYMLIFVGLIRINNHEYV